MWEHPSPPAFEGRILCYHPPCICPTPATAHGRSRDPRGHLQLGQAPADSVCNGNSALGAHQAVPKVDHLHLSQGLQGLQGGSAGQGEGQTSSPSPPWPTSHPESVDTLCPLLHPVRPPPLNLSPWWPPDLQLDLPPTLFPRYSQNPLPQAQTLSGSLLLTGESLGVSEGTKSPALKHTLTVVT